MGVAGCVNQGRQEPTSTIQAKTQTNSPDSGTQTDPAMTTSGIDTSNGGLEQSWPYQRRDVSNTAHAPAEASPEPTNLSREWRYSTQNNDMNTPILRGNLLVASTDSPNGDVFGLDPETGNERWSSRSDTLLLSEPVFVSDSVFAVRPHRATSDSITTVHGELSAPSISVGSARILRSSGEELILGGKTSGTFEILGGAPGASEPAWRFQFSFDRGDITDIAIKNDILYVGTVEYKGDVSSGPGSVSAFDLETEKMLWAQGTDTALVSLAVDPDSVYVTTRGSAIALHRDDGSVKWERDSIARGFRTPAINSELVYIGDRSKLVAHEKASGNTVWETELNGGGLRPSIGGETVYVTTNGAGDVPNKLVAVDATTGEVLFKTEFADRLISTPVIANNGIFIGVEGGTVLNYK